jgi:hypothetical protein
MKQALPIAALAGVRAVPLCGRANPYHRTPAGSVHKPTRPQSSVF